MMIAKIIREELETFRRELKEMKRNVQEKTTGISGLGSYSAAVKNKKKESILIVQSLKEQESETTKKLVKEKVAIKKMEVGITKLRKGSKGSVILGCESEGEMEKLKDTVREKLGEDFKITEPKKIRPKIKVVNVGEEEIQLKDEILINTIKKQNTIDGREDEEFSIKIVKRIVEDDSLILEIDEMTHELMLRREKINIR
ncbi:uncharacterized protein LOC105427145 [Pogonomyrmex barbatus]|uniref:Uncharacterized protein LOC105427145 n=1 Tax=Pogonomyrmex barbatus TaxID=144034 RepID=A0A6I9W983_9HYME|nr:uncharacterized protein LOC105427145 [Pogonomyrmex barbatus]